MPSRKRSSSSDAPAEATGARVRPLWSGTITFGLVSIPVELVTAVRPRQTAMKLVDKAGHALGREYHCSKEDKKLSQDELVRGYETDSGKMVVVTDGDQKVLMVDNPDALKGHEGHHMAITGTEKGDSIHVDSMKML